MCVCVCVCVCIYKSMYIYYNAHTRALIPYSLSERVCVVHANAHPHILTCALAISLSLYLDIDRVGDVIFAFKDVNIDL